MKYRIKFSKTGDTCYIGHLDMMRYFQKAVKRAGLDVRYSEGFNPHQLMSFALPLGIGVESTGEYMDLTLNASAGEKETMDALNDVMAKGIEILEIRELPDDKKRTNSMALVAAASYRIGISDESSEDVFKIVDSFKNSERILMEKETKKGTKTVDLKESVYDLTEKNGELLITLSAGSVLNLKPEEVISFLAGRDLNRINMRIIRTEMFGILDGQLVPLIDMDK